MCALCYMCMCVQRSVAVHRYSRINTHAQKAISGAPVCVCVFAFVHMNFWSFSLPMHKRSCPNGNDFGLPTTAATTNNPHYYHTILYRHFTALRLLLLHILFDDHN